MGTKANDATAVTISRRATLSLGLSATSAALFGCEGKASPLGPGAAVSPHRDEENQRSSAKQAASVWLPEKTRAFVVCLGRFQGEPEGQSTWSISERNDPAFVELLRTRGVPREQLVHLADQAATSEAIQTQLAAALAQSKPDETLLIYVGSHGSYKAKTDAHGFSSFDGHLPVETILAPLESSFRGANVLLFSDTCYSGGFVEKAEQSVKRRSGQGFAYGAVSSTGAHQVAWSGWRFVDLLIRAFSGNPVVDEDADGAVSLSDLARYASRHMAFIAEGRSISLISPGLSPAFALAKAARKSHPRVGERLEVEWPAPPKGSSERGSFYAAEVIEARGTELKVHYTANLKTESDEWVSLERTRPFRPAQYEDGAAVMVKSSSKKWYPARVKGRFESLHLCSYDGWSEAYDEWFGPSRIRAAEGESVEAAGALPAPSDELPK